MALLQSMRSALGSSADLFTLLGVACAAYFSYKLLRTYLNGIKVFFLSRSLGLSTNLKRMGSWAVVTGATDGIGKAYAEQLADKGLNVVLISRSLDKLKDVAKEIELKFKVKTKIITVDFSGGSEVYPLIQSDLEGLDVGVLVNNVGRSYGCPGRILDFENREKMFMDMININMTSMTMMTNIVLPGMVERKKGVVINISSLSGEMPTPWLSIYSGSKAYADFFSRAVHEEYKSKGIIIQSVLPGFVATKMSRMNPSLIVPSPGAFVRSALATVGLQNRTEGYWAHAIMAMLLEALPAWIYYRLVINAMAAARAKVLRRQQREGKAK